MPNAKSNGNGHKKKSIKQSNLKHITTTKKEHESYQGKDYLANKKKAMRPTRQQQEAKEKALEKKGGEHLLPEHAYRYKQEKGGTHRFEPVSRKDLQKMAAPPSRHPSSNN